MLSKTKVKAMQECTKLLEGIKVENVITLYEQVTEVISKDGSAFSLADLFLAMMIVYTDHANIVFNEKERHTLGS